MDERDARVRNEKLQDEGLHTGGSSVPPSGARMDDARNNRNPNGMGTWVWVLLILAVVGIGAYMWVDKDEPGTAREAAVRTDRDVQRDAPRRPAGDAQGLAGDSTTLKEIQDQGANLRGRSVSLNDVTVSEKKGDRSFTVRSDDGSTMLALLGTQDQGSVQVNQGQNIMLHGFIREGGKAASEHLAAADARLVADAPRYIEVTKVMPR